MFDMRKSNKANIDSPEHYIIVKDDIVFLRILGDEPNYQVMTATAGEDNGTISCFTNQGALLEAAQRVSAQLNILPVVKKDHLNREYVAICECEYLSDAYRAAEILFNKLDDYRDNRSSREMREVYSDLAMDDSGQDIYLCDGMWLCSDGTLRSEN